MDLSNIRGSKRKADDMTEKVFTMPRDSVAGIMEHLQQTVGQKLTDEELLRGRMVLEETFARLQAGMNNPDMTATVRIKKRFGDIHLVLSARGEAVNPIMSLTEWVEDDIDLYSVNVLKANRDRMGYSRKNGANVISIKVHEASVGTIYKISASIFLGLLLGFIMRECAPQAVILAFDHYFKTPITTLFMNALGMMVAPVIFFSIIAGITNLSETIDIGRIGKRLVGQSFFVVFLAAVLSVGLALAIFPDDLAFMASLFGSKLEGDGSNEGTMSFMNILMQIVPANLVDPFKGGNLLQILFLAIFFGIIINRLGEKANIAKEIIDFMNSFCMSIMGMIARFYTLIIFVTMMSLAIHIDLQSLANFGKIVMASIIGTFAMWVLLAIVFMIYGQINPLPFFKKILPFAPIPLSNCSSTISLPHMLQLTMEKLGVSQGLASFALPIGIQLNQTGACCILASSTVMMARVMNIPITMDFVLFLTFYVFVISYTMPAVPGGGLIAMATVFAVFDIPTQAVVVFMCVEVLADMFDTLNNVSVNIASSLLLAKKCDMWDEKIYLDQA